MNILILSLLFIIAALLHGISGIGFPIASTTALSLFMPLKEAVVLALWPTLLVNVLSVISGGRISQILYKYGLLAFFSLVGTDSIRHSGNSLGYSGDTCFDINISQMPQDCGV